MKRFKDKKTDVRVFESMSECLTIKPSKANAAIHKDNIQSYKYQGNDWLGCEGKLDGFLKLYREGWAEGAKRLEDMTASLPSLDTTIVKRQRVYGPAGASVDMRKVYSGNINKAWQSRKRLSKAGKRRLSIIFHGSILGHKPSSILFARGAAAVKIAQAYQDAGYAVSIHSMTATRSVENSNQNRRHYYFFPVKLMGEHQSKEKMASACLAGVQRVFSFWAREATEGAISSGYGRTIDLEDVDGLLPSALPIDRDNLIYVPASVHTIQDAERFIENL